MSKLLPPAALVAEARRVGRPCPPQAGGGSRAPSRTTSLPFPQAKNLINALAFAESLLPPSAAWAHATICLGQSPHDISDPRRYLALQGRILARVREWLLSLGLPAHCLWVREIGPRYGGPHSHILLPV